MKQEDNGHWIISEEIKNLPPMEKDKDDEY